MATNTYLEFIPNHIKDKKLAKKENPHDDKIELLLKWGYQGLANVIEYNTLDYFYYIRIIFENIDKYQKDEVLKELYNDPLLNELVKEPFDYYEKYKDVFNKDKSLKAIKILCFNEILQKNPNYEDINLTYLTKYFNYLTDTNRELLRCYDCGTNARGIFLNLIKANRPILNENGEIFTNEEKIKIKNDYNNSSTEINEKIDTCFKLLSESEKECIVIISLGLVESGHVFVLEKRFINDAPIIRHYQSALNSHMVIDFLFANDIANRCDISLDYITLFKDIKYL